MRSITMMTCLLCLFSFAARADDGWIEDFEQAKATAAKEGKDILIDFTGSDWCGWCIKLHQEVFEKSDFQTEAPKKFVLLMLDFPRTKAQSAKLKKQNTELAEQFGVEGYPTVILTDSTGRMYGKTGYQPGGDRKYLQHLDSLKLSDLVHQKLTAKDHDGAMKLIDDFMTQHTLATAEKQQLLFMKAVVWSTKGDEPNTMVALKTAYDTDPKSESGERIAQLMDEYKKRTKKD